MQDTARRVNASGRSYKPFPGTGKRIMLTDLWKKNCQENFCYCDRKFLVAPHPCLQFFKKGLAANLHW